VAHWYDAPESWATTTATVSQAELLGVLGSGIVLDPARSPPVSYARRCRVAGRSMPHLVVQGQQGPVMVLLMAHRRLESPLGCPGQKKDVRRVGSVE